MEIIERVTDLLNRAKLTEQRLEQEIAQNVAVIKRNLQKIENRVDVSLVKKETLRELTKVKNQVIADLRSYALNAQLGEIEEASNRLLLWKKHSHAIHNKGRLIASAKDNTLFQDKVGCLAACLIDCRIIESEYYYPEFLESLDADSLHTLAMQLELDSVHHNFSDILFCLSEIMQYEIKPVKKRVVKLQPFFTQGAI